MKNVTVKDIVKVTGGILLCGDENYEITNFSIDSRTTKEGELFIPIVGEKVDSHRFIENALQNGGATLTQQHREKEGSKAWIYVENTMQALQKIAKWYREKMTFPVVAVTGSVGKTTTREMVTRALEAGFRVFHTEGNYNSQIGVPLTIARMTGEEDVAVLEAGMSEVGEMAKLESMIAPNYVVFTNIGVAHIENLGSRENICTEKMALAKNISQDGVVFLNGDDKVLMSHRDDFACRVVTYGTNETCDYYAKDICNEQGQMKFNCVRKGETFEIVLDVLGNHNVLNSLAAFGVAEELGLTMEQVRHQFEHFEGTRQKIHKLTKYTVIDDTYNASPDSMLASLDVLSQMMCDGKKIAVLGDMLELGEKSEEYHRAVGKEKWVQMVQEVYTFGKESKFILEEASKNNVSILGKHFDDREKLIVYLKSRLETGDCILLKGSNGMKLSEVVKELI